jgi:hypothetical protein
MAIISRLLRMFRGGGTRTGTRPAGTTTATRTRTRTGGGGIMSVVNGFLRRGRRRI